MLPRYIGRSARGEATHAPVVPAALFAPATPGALRDGITARTLGPLRPAKSLCSISSWQSAPTLSGQVPPPPPPTVEEAAEEAGPPYSPRGAFFRSLVLPGWGQAYVDAPARGAVYFSLASGSVWMAWVARRQLSDARREQYWMRQTGEIGPTDETNIAVSREQQFEDWAALSVFLFFFAGADAYVSAYLLDFGERIGVQPGADGQLRIQTMIPVGPRR